MAGVRAVARFVAESQLVLAGSMAQAFLRVPLRVDSAVILRCG
jgi:hypothetical protein